MQYPFVATMECQGIPQALLIVRCHDFGQLGFSDTNGPQMSIRRPFYYVLFHVQFYHRVVDLASRKMHPDDIVQESGISIQQCSAVVTVLSWEKWNSTDTEVG